MSSLSDNKTRRRYFFVSAFFGSALTLILDTVFTVDVGRENRRHRLFVGSLLRCTHAHTHHECKAQH